MTRRYPARQRARTRSHNQQNTPASGHHSLKRWAICGAAVFAFVIALWWLLGDATTNFTAALTYDKPVVITYDGSYLDKKSPACGCAKAAPDEWRGISFISRRISIGPIQTRQSTITGYMLSAAFPELINPLSVSAFRLDSTFYLLRPHSASSSFNSFAISHGLFDFSGYEVVKKIDVPSGPMLSIFSTGPLVIDAIGETPIGAWIPGSGSKLTIQKARSTTSTTTRYEIFEDFSSRARKQESKDDDWTKDPSILGPENYPIVDFIGPTFVAWSDTPIKFYGHRGLVFTSPNSTPEEKFVSVFVIKVPFALRAVMGDSLLPTLDAHAEQESIYANNKISRMLVNAPAEGILKATLSETPQGPVDYSNLEQSIDGHPIIVARVQDGPFKGSMIFRKPPIPSFDGFNVFGQVQKIEFEAASGKIMLGTQQQNIEPSAPIGILNANAYETPAPKLTIPIQLKSDSITVAPEFAARGNITINGEPVVRRIDEKKSLFTTIAGIISVLSVGSWLVYGLRFYPQKDGSGGTRS